MHHADGLADKLRRLHLAGHIGVVGMGMVGEGQPVGIGLKFRAVAVRHHGKVKVILMLGKVPGGFLVEFPVEIQVDIGTVEVMGLFEGSKEGMLEHGRILFRVFIQIVQEYDGVIHGKVELVHGVIELVNHHIRPVAVIGIDGGEGGAVAVNGDFQIIKPGIRVKEGRLAVDLQIGILCRANLDCDVKNTVLLPTVMAVEAVAVNRKYEAYGITNMKKVTHGNNLAFLKMASLYTKTACNDSVNFSNFDGDCHGHKRPRNDIMNDIAA